MPIVAVASRSSASAPPSGPPSSARGRSTLRRHRAASRRRRHRRRVARRRSATRATRSALLDAGVRGAAGEAAVPHAGRGRRASSPRRPGTTARLLYAENLAYAPVVQRLLALVPAARPADPPRGALAAGSARRGASSPPTSGAAARCSTSACIRWRSRCCSPTRPATARRSSVSATLRGGAGHGSDEHAEVFAHVRAAACESRVESSWQRGPSSRVGRAGSPATTGVLRAELLPPPQLEHNGEPRRPARRRPSALPQIEQYGYLAQLRALADDLAARDHPGDERVVRTVRAGRGVRGLPIGWT